MQGGPTHDDVTRGTRHGARRPVPPSGVDPIVQETRLRGVGHRRRVRRDVEHGHHLRTDDDVVITDTDTCPEPIVDPRRCPGEPGASDPRLVQPGSGVHDGVPMVGGPAVRFTNDHDVAVHRDRRPEVVGGLGVLLINPRRDFHPVDVDPRREDWRRGAGARLVGPVRRLCRTGEGPGVTQTIGRDVVVARRRHTHRLVDYRLVCPSIARYTWRGGPQVK